MNKREFLDELENALSGRLSESDIREITSDYGDIFENGMENGKAEDAVAAELGSPAKIARTILEDGGAGFESGRGAGFESGRGAGSESGKPEGEREYTDFQKNINEKTSKIIDRVVEPDLSVDPEALAPMARRLGAYVIDGILLGVIGIGAILALFAPFLYMVRSSSAVHYVDMGPMAGHVLNAAGPASRFAFANILILFLVMGAFNLFTTIILWATNGYTPGKYLLGMRVVKINGEKITFLDALLRELVMKCIANSFLSGFLNVGSFIWGCVTEDHKTVHDLVARTRVVERNQAGK